MRKKNIFVTDFEDYGGTYDEPDVAEEEETGLDDAAGEEYEGYEGYEDWTDEGDEETEEGAEVSADENVEEDASEDDGYADEDDYDWDVYDDYETE